MEPDLEKNYEELHTATGESYESIADRVEAVGDAVTAAQLRSKASGKEPEAKTDPPKARSAGNLPVTASASGSETPPAGDTETAAK